METNEFNKKILDLAEDALPENGFVYFISDGSAVKIGYTRQHPKERIRLLQTGNPNRLKLVYVIYGGDDIEKWLHKHYNAMRLVGEWFNITIDDLNWLDSCRLNLDTIKDGYNG